MLTVYEIRMSYGKSTFEWVFSSVCLFLLTLSQKVDDKNAGEILRRTNTMYELFVLYMYLLLCVLNSLRPERKTRKIARKFADMIFAIFYVKYSGTTSSFSG